VLLAHVCTVLIGGYSGAFDPFTINEVKAEERIVLLSAVVVTFVADFFEVL